MRKILAKYFEEFWKKAKKKRKLQILDLLEKDGEANLLDLGCDDGSFTDLIAEKLGSGEKSGVEINDIAAKEAGRRGIAVKRFDLNNKFEFKSSKFDVIVADQVIEHLWDLDNFAGEIYRVLKSRGYAIISTENLASWHNIGALILGLQPFTGPSVSKKQVIGMHPLTPNIKYMFKKYANTINMPPHTKVLTLTSLTSLFKLYNFKIESVKVSGYFPLPLFLGELFNILDKRHSFFITVKIRKHV